MKKVLILFSSVLVFACGDNTKNTTGEEGGNNINSSEHVEDITHENRSPQLTEEAGSETRYNVDTIRSAESAKEQAEEKSLEK